MRKFMQVIGYLTLVIFASSSILSLYFYLRTADEWYAAIGLSVGVYAFVWWKYWLKVER